MIVFAVPVYNEENILEDSINILYAFLKKHFVEYEWLIVLVDNGSTDKTLEICQRLSRDYAPHIQYLKLEQKGKGLAIRHAFNSFEADFYFFTDVDLSVGLDALLRAFDLLLAGYDLIVGSRTNRQYLIKRTLIRKIVGWFYRTLIINLFKIKISDPACGFKAMNYKTVKNLLPLVYNNEYFFDTELVIVATREKYRIKEIGVEWIDSRNPKRQPQIKIILETIKYLQAILKRLVDNLKYRE